MATHPQLKRVRLDFVMRNAVPTNPSGTTPASSSADEPTDEEIAAALAAVRLALRRQGHHGTGESRWMRAGQAESVAALPRPATWRTAERPR